MKKFLLITFFLSVVISDGVAQNVLEGKWYTFSFNHVIEIDIRRDSLITRKLLWDLQPNFETRKYYQSSVVIENRSYEDRYYYAIKKSRDPEDEDDEEDKKAGIAIFRIARPGLEMVMLEPETEYTDSASLSRLMVSDTSSQVGLSFLSEREVLRLIKLPSITKMNAKDCNEFGLKIIEKRAKLEAEKLSPSFYQGLYMIRTLLGEAGYSPFFTKKQFDEWHERFSKDPATQKIMEQVFQEN